MKEISVKIKEARNKKGLSIAEVSTAIKINAKTLQAIEDYDEKNLPAKPFLRGFIQTYARYLELNVDEIMNRFAEEIGTTKPKIQQSGDLPLTSTESHDESQRKIEMYKKIGMGASALIGALLIWGIFKIIGKYEAENKAAREQRQEVLKTETAATEIAPATPAPGTVSTETTPSVETKPETTPSVTTETSAPATPAKVEVVAKSATETKPTVPPVVLTPTTPTKIETPVKPTVETKPAAPAVVLAPPVPVKIETVAKPIAESKPTTTAVSLTPPTPTKVETVVKPVTETKPAVPAVAVVEKPKPSRPQEVVLEALDSVEIRYQKDGEGEKSMKLQPEKVLVIRAKDKVAITISDGGAINVIHNGKDKGVPGSLGQSVKLSYP